MFDDLVKLFAHKLMLGKSDDC